MKRLLCGGAALVGAIAALGALATAPTAVAADAGCPTGDTVVKVYQNVVNDDSAGVAGNAWASTSYQRNITVIRTGGHSFCAYTAIGGKFLTNAGTSPGATGVVASGIPGPFYARWTSNVFTATFRPSVATSGTLPTVDFACDASFNCPGFVDWLTYYFTDVSGFGLVSSWQWFYGGTYGTWRYINAVSYGDIVSR
jgi:hypothetical protein